MIGRPPRRPLFPYATLFGSPAARRRADGVAVPAPPRCRPAASLAHSLRRPECPSIATRPTLRPAKRVSEGRSEEHTSELHSHLNLLFPLLLENKNSDTPPTQ